LNSYFEIIELPIFVKITHSSELNKFFRQILFERWQETALLVFLALDFVCRKKPNVLFVRLAFQLAENGPV
jgi:hypothetical protein